ncbi:related to NRPS-like enzyme [Phialocephala subalpina]|uniref:Related to NRPS-like enzyme n=1 Tax=Phialocephala subalpina TaxID=576137 RepID=A0A1L7WFB7_9HELO|nr:related to NRPS-like enzyme [Phialocephala subalpina]
MESEVRYGQRLVPQIIDESATHDPTRPVGMSAESADISKGFIKVTIGDVAKAIDFMAYWFEDNVGREKDFETWAVVFGGIKCSKKILLPSVRNSSANNVFLLEETFCKTVLCTESQERVAKELQKHIDVEVLVIPSWDEMLCSQPRSYAYTKSWDEARDDQIIVLHTSGSTGNPRPIPYTHAFLSFFDAIRTLPIVNGKKLHNVSTLELGHTDYFYMAFPLFHLFGLSFSMRSLLYDGVIVLGPSQTAQDTKIATDIMANVPCKAIALPPSLLEDMVKEFRADFEKNTSELLHVLYGGGPLAESTGNYLSRRVRDMCMIYGQTEIAMPPLLVPDPEDWQYFHFHPTHSGIELEPIHDEEDHYELVLNRKSPKEWWQPVFENFPHLEQWRTKDLFKKHPTKPGLWLFKGRKDDTIVLSNTEKFNPVSMETVIQGNSAVKGALVVGTGKFQCGLVIEPQVHEDNDELISQTWPTVEEANSQVPGHGQIDRELVTVSKAEKPFQRTGKGTVMRYFTTQSYAGEMDELCSAFDKQVCKDLPILQAPKSPTAVRQLLREILMRQLQDYNVADDADFFELGLDSLKIIQISRILQNALGSTPGPGRMTSRLLYEHPSISKLSSAIYKVLSNRDASLNGYARDAKRVAEMESLVDRYTSNVPPIPQKKVLHRTKAPLNVILTGSTGSLGSQILDQLLKDPMIGTIYCLDRSADANERFIERRLAQDKRINNPFSRIRWLQVDTSEPNFSLPDAKFNALLQDVDIIILNAWKVDFNHSLSSFSRQIQSVHKFANFSIISPRNPHLFFISSTSAVGNYFSVHPSQTKIPEAVTDNVAVAAPMGYGESKLVSERILDKIAEFAPKHTNFNILRVGQIAGLAQEQGTWNENEWFPSLLKTSRMLGKLPETLGMFDDVDWIPVDIAARVVTDVVHSSFEVLEEKGAGEGVRVYNLVNPSHVQFGSLVPAIKKRLGAGVEAVSFDTWVEALEELDRESEDVSQRYPALKILDFFQGLRRNGDMKSLEYVTNRSVGVSQTMRVMGPVTVEMTEKWMRGWGM